MAQPTYTVGQLARMSGTSVRTLHHYEDMGLLVPARRANGYRTYTSADAERLQQILLFRACGMELGQIRELLDAPGYSARDALEGHMARLREQRAELDQLIGTVEDTILHMDEGIAMEDERRFEGLKRKAVEENEAKYGAEARRRHGDAAVDAANERLLGMSEQEWNDVNALEASIIEQLKAAMATGDAAGPEARALCDMHARWIELHWGKGAYNREAHIQLAHGYLANDGFRTYYDSRAGEGACEFLVAALDAWAEA